MTYAVIAAIVAVIVVVFCISFFFIKKTGKFSSPESRRDSNIKTVSNIGIESDTHQLSRRQVNTDTPVDASSHSESLKSRFTAISIFAGVVFTAIAAKLLSMQIFSSSSYLKQANENQFTTVYTPAPRGCIYDRNGVLLAKNRTSQTVLADADVINDRDVINRLSVVLGIPHNAIRMRIQDTTLGSQNKRVIASDVSMRNIAFISEHSTAFNGITIESRTVREYQYGALGAHVLGYIGPVSKDEMDTKTKGRKIELGDNIGKSGVEAFYDDILAGDHGEKTVVADANGNVVRIESETQPKAGSDLYLTIDARIQYLCDTRLASLIAPNGGIIGTGSGVAGAIVVIDVTDGSVIALSSFPTYLPGAFVGGISEEDWEIYNSQQAYNPLMNRAIAGTYPAASTFKAFTGSAGLEYGYVTGDKTWNCTGSWDGFGSGDWQDCWQTRGHGNLDFYSGIVVSCDVIFYEIGKAFFDDRNKIGEDAMQNEIKKFGFGALTDIDLPGEAYGRVPTAQWKKEYFRDVPEEASWRGGDTTNMSIGQGYVLITPMQEACAYGSIATGKLVTPHVLKEIKNSNEDTVISYQTKIKSEIDIKKDTLEVVRDALAGVAIKNEVVAKAFSGVSEQVAAKTGTAEVAGKNDFAWTACYAPYDNPKYAVAVIIEEGGGGADKASPIAAAVLADALNADSDSLNTEIGYVAGFAGKVDTSGIRKSGSGRTD